MVGHVSELRVAHDNLAGIQGAIKLCTSNPCAEWQSRRAEGFEWGKSMIDAQNPPPNRVYRLLAD